MKPAIGITTFIDVQQRSGYVSVSENYPRSVRLAGGLPLMLPIDPVDDDIDARLDRIDGLLLSGGPDLAPYRYGEAPMRQVNKSNSARDEFELRLFRRARERGMPVLGICRGHQLVNVAMGGTLYQDIGAQLPKAGGHLPEGMPVDEPHHWVRITDRASELYRAFGTDRILTNSFHHQAVKTLAPGLRQTAEAEGDGIVEAFEGADGGAWLMCVQFHPECFTVRFPEFVGMFRLFVEAASRNGK